MDRRLVFPFLLVALAASCGGSAEDPLDRRGPYAITLTGPTKPFRGDAMITATPQPATGTVEVRFSIDGVDASAAKAAPYAVDLDFTKQWGGAHQITARAVRDDGATATATIEVTYDPLAPFVTVLAPAAGAHVSPEGGTVDLALTATDPSGLAAGAVQLDDGTAISIPMPALKLTIPVPAATELPVTPTLSWWVDDTVGNRAQGTVTLLQTHERWRSAFANGGALITQGDGTIVVLGAENIRALDAGGSTLWTANADMESFVTLFPAQGGDFFATRSPPKQFSAVDALARFRADGTLTWEWTAGGVIYSTAYVPALDSVFVVVGVSGSTDWEIDRVDATGQAAIVHGADATGVGAVLVTPPGASPAGYAILTAPDSVVQHLDVFDATGSPAWSCDMAFAGASPSMLTRDAVFGTTPPSAPPSPPPDHVIVGPAGVVASVTGGAVTVAAPDGDLVFPTVTPGGHGVTRMHPDGTVVWQVPADDEVLRLQANGTRVAVVTAASVQIVDAAGAVVPWTRLPDDTSGPAAPNVTFEPDGAFWVTSPLANNQQRVYRAGADGKTLWHETLTDTGALVAPYVTGTDTRLVFGLTASGNIPARVHVFDP